MQVMGRAFRDTPELKCSFGPVAVQARFVSPITVNCTTPQHAAGLATVVVSDDRLEASSGEVHAHRQRMPIVIAWAFACVWPCELEDDTTTERTLFRLLC